MTLITGEGTKTKGSNGLTQITAETRDFKKAWGDLVETIQASPTLGGKIGTLFGFGNINESELNKQLKAYKKITEMVEGDRLARASTPGLAGLPYDNDRVQYIIDGLKDVTEESKEYAKATIRVNEAGELVIPTQKQFGVALKSSAAQAKVCLLYTSRCV